MCATESLPSVYLTDPRGYVSLFWGFAEYRINVFSVFIIGWNMCCNFSLSKMLQNYSFTYPKKKKNGGREEAPKMSGFLLHEIVYLNVDF